MIITREHRKQIRHSLSNIDYPTNLRIEILPGIALAPQLVGERYHYETKTGKRIIHPSAYATKGWSTMQYIPSTRKIVVGENWFSCEEK